MRWPSAEAAKSPFWRTVTATSSPATGAGVTFSVKLAAVPSVTVAPGVTVTVGAVSEPSRTVTVAMLGTLTRRRLSLRRSITCTPVSRSTMVWAAVGTVWTTCPLVESVTLRGVARCSSR